MSPEPFDARAKALPAKRSEKGYGDENASRGVNLVPRVSHLPALPERERREPGNEVGEGFGRAQI